MIIMSLHNSTVATTVVRYWYWHSTVILARHNNISQDTIQINKAKITLEYWHDTILT